MARPTKRRRIQHIPKVAYFAALEDVSSPMPCNELKLEELEALRLKDLEGMEQEECARRMEVSRPTFQRILLSAREKIADSLVNGKGIHITGGEFNCGVCPVRCTECGDEWSQACDTNGCIEHNALLCPRCKSGDIQYGAGHSEGACRSGCRRHGRKEERNF